MTFDVQTWEVRMIDDRGHEEDSNCRSTALLSQRDSKKTKILEFVNSSQDPKTQRELPVASQQTQKIFESIDPDVFGNLNSIELGEAYLNPSTLQTLSKLPALKKLTGWRVKTLASPRNWPLFPELKELGLIIEKEATLAQVVKKLRAFSCLDTLWLHPRDMKEGFYQEDLRLALDEDHKQGNRNTSPSVKFLD